MRWDRGDGMVSAMRVLQNVSVNQFVPQTFCLCFAFTGMNFGGMLHHVYDEAYDENMCGPIRTRKCRSKTD